MPGTQLISTDIPNIHMPVLIYSYFPNNNKADTARKAKVQGIRMSQVAGAKDCRVVGTEDKLDILFRQMVRFLRKLLRNEGKLALVGGSETAVVSL